MNPLSKRLNKIIEVAEECDCLADVGCDHGYISIGIIRANKAKRAIGTDINQGPIDRAKSNIIAEGLEDRITLKKCDGLAAITAGCVDEIVIAGMGGGLVKDIISKGIEAAKLAKNLILSPQSEIEEFREFLSASGFAIKDEYLVCDQGKFYIIIKASFDGIKRSLSAAEKKYGPALINKKDPLLQEYLEIEYDNLTKLLKHLSDKGVAKRVAALEGDIALNREVLRSCEMF